MEEQLMQKSTLSQHILWHKGGFSETSSVIGLIFFFEKIIFSAQIQSQSRDEELHKHTHLRSSTTSFSASE